MITEDAEVLEVAVNYGLGAGCAGSFPRRAVTGLPAREVVQKVIRSPQASESAARTARVLTRVMESGRPIDVELAEGAEDDASPGTPIALDDVVVPEVVTDEIVPRPARVTVSLSESYRGG